MTGIGRAWAFMPFEVVQKMAQLCDHPGLFTNLHLPYGIGLTEQHVCPLRKLQQSIRLVPLQLQQNMGSRGQTASEFRRSDLYIQWIVLRVLGHS